MEYIEGKTLAQLLEDRDAFPMRETLKIAVEIAAALSAAHKQNIIHRDVKPANIMIENGVVKLTDFGLARFADNTDNISSSNEILGTPLYLPPEYIRGEILDPRMDHYSRITVKEAVNKETLCDGVCYVVNHLSPVIIERCPDGPGYRMVKGAKRDSESTELSQSVFAQALSTAAKTFGYKRG